MLNEGEVTQLWQRLFTEEAVTAQGLQRAEELIEQLRAESPLRFRLQRELGDIRRLHAFEAAPLRKVKR